MWGQTNMQRTLLAACAAAAIFPFAAFADDDTPAQPAKPEAVLTYQPVFFETFNALTALDMVQRVPGFSMDEGESVRGFGGAAGNVLIDGERPSSKESLGSILQRIPASQVERVEHIRGSVSGIDMRGQTEVVNVVRAEGASGGSGAWEANFRIQEGEPVVPFGEASYSGQAGRADYTVSFESDGYRAPWNGPEFLFRPDGTLIERREEEGRDTFRNYKIAGNTEIELGAWTVRANADADWRWYEYPEPGRAFGPDGEFLRLDELFIDDSSENFSFGGDVERDFGEALSFKLIGLQKLREFQSEQTSSRFDSGGFNKRTRQTIANDEGESILRGVVTWIQSPRSAFDFGVEGAYNFLESDVDLTVDEGNGFVVIPLPVTEAKVEEYRGEAFASWVWEPSDRLTIEPGLTVEVSRITQSGSVQAERDFIYPKPSLAVTWDYASDRQIRLLAEREVAQLNFFDFVTSSSLSDDQTNVGNPDLKPQRTWRLRGEWEKRFWTEGVITLLGEFGYVEEVQDLIPIGEPGKRFDAPGNLGNGDYWRARVSATAPLDRLGLTNAQLEAYAETGDSSVTDPVTGRTRIFSDRRHEEWYVEFRQDFPDRKFSYGFDYYQGGDVELYFIDEVRRFENGPGDLDVFVETTRVPGVTVRLSLENIGNVDFARRRDFFDGPRDTGQLAAYETREKQNGVTGYLTFRGTF